MWCVCVCVSLQIDTAVCSDVVSAVREELVQGEEDEDSKPPKCVNTVEKHCIV